MQLEYARAMSSTTASDGSTAPVDVSAALECCRPVSITPVTLHADSLGSTTTAYLGELKRELRDEGVTPIELSVTARFDESCSLESQAEVDRIRRYVRAGSYLGVDVVSIQCDRVADPDIVRPALAACIERGARDGLSIEVDGPVHLDATTD